MFLAYGRVSTEDQDKPDRTSMAEQERQLRGYAMQKGVKEFDLVFYRDVVSGSTPLASREAGAQLIAAVQKGDTVVAAKVDRMFRSTLDALTVAEDFRQRGIDLGFLDFMGGEPVTGKGLAQCFFTITSAFAQLERDRIRERMQDGKRAKKRNGGHLGGSAPYGWQVIGTGREARLEPVADEQHVIAEARRLTYHNIPSVACRELNRLGFRDRAGSEFRINQVQRLCEREIAGGANA